jgi:hypothetical protein
MAQRRNNYVPIYDRRLFIDAVERRRVAYHAAAQAVVGYWFGWQLNDDGVTIRQSDYYYHDFRRRRELFLSPEQADVCVRLAGRLAEALLYPSRVQSPSDDELLTILDFACWDDEWPDDDADDFLTLRRLRETRDIIRDEELLAAYRAYEAEAMALLACPSIWQSVERIATALLERGTLTDDEASALLVTGVFAGGLQARQR